MMSGPGDEGWKIGSAREVCASCSKAFDEGERFLSEICRVEDRFERHDLCSKCEPERPEGAFATWRSLARGPDASGPRPPEPELLLELLRRLLESTEPDDEVLSACLALYLARKKRLKRVGHSRDGGSMMVEYRESVSGETIVVPELEMNEEALERAEDSLTRILEGLTSSQGGPAAVAAESISPSEPGLEGGGASEVKPDQGVEADAAREGKET